MKKVFDLEDLDCANCANRMECNIRKINGVKSASINFITQKMTVEADEEIFDDIMKSVVKTCKKIEPDCTIKL